MLCNAMQCNSIHYTLSDIGSTNDDQNEKGFTIGCACAFVWNGSSTTTTDMVVVHELEIVFL